MSEFMPPPSSFLTSLPPPPCSSLPLSLSLSLLVLCHTCLPMLPMKTRRFMASASRSRLDPRCCCCCCCFVGCCALLSSGPVVSAGVESERVALSSVTVVVSCTCTFSPTWSWSWSWSWLTVDSWACLASPLVCSPPVWLVEAVVASVAVVVSNVGALSDWLDVASIIILVCMKARRRKRRRRRRGRGEKKKKKKKKKKDKNKNKGMLVRWFALIWQRDAGGVVGQNSKLTSRQRKEDKKLLLKGARVCGQAETKRTARKKKRDC